MRLPGTSNIPNATKRRKGRTKRLATVYKATDALHHLETLADEFPPPPERDRPRTKAEAKEWQKYRVTIDMEAVRAADTYDDLPGGLRERFEKSLNEIGDAEGAVGTGREEGGWRPDRLRLRRRPSAFTWRGSVSRRRTLPIWHGSGSSRRAPAVVRSMAVHARCRGCGPRRWPLSRQTSSNRRWPGSIGPGLSS